MASATPNRLIHESSPYLLQHAYNPVDWFPWGEKALERSRKENKLIFLSIGYSSCHWCHVMERESFEDPRVAEYLNEHFIPIKVDREERPDLDALYMDAVQLMTGQGGWPLNIWLTPALIPIYGGTYFPPAPAWQRPDFMSVLQRLVHIFTDEPEQLSGHIRQMQQAMELDLYRHINASPLNPDALDQAFSGIRSLYDAVHGGFSQAPKFPQAMSIEFLLQYARRTGNQAAESMGIHSLSAMVCGGIYDQIGGGFHRYSTDKYWLVPHFEKMLYDNVLLLTALTSAWQVSKQVLFKETVEETVEFLKREMLDPDGGFYSAIDADSEGREGRYYVWTYDELQALLNKTELDELRRWYSFDEEGNWEGSIILSRENPSGMVPPDRSPLKKKDEDWSRLRDKLLNTRRKREHPQTDDKVLTAWNGLLIKSLVQAARAFGRRDWLETAITTADFILNNLYRDGILHRIYRDGNVRQPGFLDDYGSFAESLTWIFEATARERYLETARELTEKMLHLFYDEDNRAFYFSGDYRDVPVRQLRDIFDNVTPSGTSSALTALTRLSDLTGEHRYYELARGILEKLQDTAVENPAAFGYFLQALIHWHEPGREVVLVGPGEERKPWREIWSSLYAPHTIFIEGEGFSESDLPLLAGKEMVNGRTAAYLCEHFMCKKPVTEINEYIREIEESHRKVS